MYYGCWLIAARSLNWYPALVQWSYPWRPVLKVENTSPPVSAKRWKWESNKRWPLSRPWTQWRFVHAPKDPIQMRGRMQLGEEVATGQKRIQCEYTSYACEDRSHVDNWCQIIVLRTKFQIWTTRHWVQLWMRWRVSPALIAWDRRPDKPKRGDWWIMRNMLQQWS